MNALASFFILWIICMAGVGVVTIGLALAYYAATWILAILTLLSIIPIWRLVIDRFRDADNWCIIACIVLVDAALWASSLIGRYPEVWAQLLQAILWSIKR